MTGSPRHRRAAWSLVVLTPLIAELALGSTPMSLAWLTILWLPIYGAGVLLIREAVRRAGRGWPSLIVLGLAYELVEDGIGLQALTSPNLYGTAEWGARVFGVNLPYWEANALYHVVFSILIPIALTDLIFPRHRHSPYLGRFGLAVTAVVAVLGVALLRISVPPSQDPGYVAPLAVPVTCAIGALVLGVVALRVFPRRPDTAQAPAGFVPSPWAPAGIGLVSTLVVLGLLFPLPGADQPAFTRGNWVLVPMAAALLLFAAGVVLVRQWSGRNDWTDRHTLFMIAGALVGHSTAGIAVFARTPFDRGGLVAIIVVTTIGIGLLARRPDLRADAPSPALR